MFQDTTGPTFVGSIPATGEHEVSCDDVPAREQLIMYDACHGYLDDGFEETTDNTVRQCIYKWRRVMFRF